MNVVNSRLANQHLVDEPFGNVEDVVQHFGAVQAQDFSGAAWALSLRLKDVNKIDVDKAFNEGRILRTHVMRPTWHFVLPEDIRWMVKLTAPRINQAMASYNRKLELDEKFFTRSNRIISEALAKEQVLTRTELSKKLVDKGVEANGQRLGHIVMQAEIDGIICSGPFRGKQFTYSLIDERAPDAKELSKDESLALLARRYFTSHGPATLQDFTWWSGLTVADAKKAFEYIKKDFQSEKIGDKEYWYKSNEQRSKNNEQVLLLSVYDEYVIAYKDYSPIFIDKTKSLTNIFGNAVLNYVIVKDGIVVGSFRRKLEPKRVVLETNLAVKLDTKYKKLLQEQANHYSQFLNLPVEVKV